MRQHWVTAGIVRTQVNARVYRLRRIFRWAVAERMLDVSVFETLRTVEELKFRRSEARESTAVVVVPDDKVEALLQPLPPVIRDMIAVQCLTGMRPGEVCTMRWSEIDLLSCCQFRRIIRDRGWAW